jgi:glycosyltransferase involved in cell wall biosynthesis
MVMKKSVLIFIEDGSFSYDNRVIREANALLEDGWQVIVVSPKYADDPFYKKASDNLHLYYYPKPNAESTVGHLVEHSISLLFGSILTGWAHLRHGFSVFHACNPMDILWLVAKPYTMLFSKKFVFDQHDLCPELYLSRSGVSGKDAFYWVLRWLEKMSFRSADVCIATNESYKQIAVERGQRAADDVFVVRNGPDLKKFKKASPKKGLKKKGEVLVGYLGNMNLQDGVDKILEVAKYITQELKQKKIKFVLVGGGSSQQSLAEQAIEDGLGDFVVFTGRVPDDEMLQVLSTCDICVQPDPYNPLNDKSTMNKVMEYMALEKPVVAFDLKETRVSCGEAAVYARPNEVKDLAEKILSLAKNAEKRRELGRMGKKRVKESLAWDYSVPKLLAAYNRLITQ